MVWINTKINKDEQIRQALYIIKHHDLSSFTNQHCNFKHTPNARCKECIFLGNHGLDCRRHDIPVCKEIIESILFSAKMDIL